MNFMKRSTLLITGGFGFIGKSFIKQKHNKFKKIFILDNLQYSVKDDEILNFKNVEFIKGDVNDEKVFKKIPKVDFICHLAAPSSIILFNKNPDDCIKTTINGFLNVINFAKKIEVKKFIYPSSGSVYGKDDSPFDETVTSPHPVNIYGRTKLATEYIARIYEKFIPVVGLRIFASFGPEENHKKDFASVITLFIKDIISGKSPIIFGDGSQTRDFIWIDDVVDTIEKVINTDFTGILNVGSGISISFNEVLDIIYQTIGVRSPASKYIDKPVNYLENTKANIKLFTRLLNRKPIDPRIKIKELTRLYLKELKKD